MRRFVPFGIVCLSTVIIVIIAYLFLSNRNQIKVAWVQDPNIYGSARQYGDGLFVSDCQSGKVVTGRIFTANNRTSEVSSDNLQLRFCSEKSAAIATDGTIYGEAIDGDSELNLVAYRDKLIWKVDLPGSTKLSGVVVKGDRVFAVAGNYTTGKYYLVTATLDGTATAVQLGQKSTMNLIPRLRAYKSGLVITYVPNDSYLYARYADYYDSSGVYTSTAYLGLLNPGTQYPQALPLWNGLVVVYQEYDVHNRSINPTLAAYNSDNKKAWQYEIPDGMTASIETALAIQDRLVIKLGKVGRIAIVALNIQDGKPLASPVEVAQSVSNLQFAANSAGGIAVVYDILGTRPDLRDAKVVLKVFSPTGNFLSQFDQWPGQAERGYSVDSLVFSRDRVYVVLDQYSDVETGVVVALDVPR